jgi:hypothetical protein
MTDYGFKKPASARVYVPINGATCAECQMPFELKGFDRQKSVLLVRHLVESPPLGDPCPFEGRLFEMEMDVRYIKEVETKV